MTNRQKPVFKIAHTHKEKSEGITRELVVIYFEERDGGSGIIRVHGEYGTYISKITGKKHKINSWYVETPGLTKYGGTNGLKFNKKSTAIKSVKAYYNK